MKKPVLIVMAAGMGSRYGGLKQMDPVGSAGELIIDFSIYDAVMAGFKKVIFIIKKEMEEDFRTLIDDKAGRFIEVEYAFQDLNDLPDGYSVPEGRVKPWGTCHAVLSCRDKVDGPFAVINADDYYGPSAFQSMYEFLEKAEDGDQYSYSMIGYLLKEHIEFMIHLLDPSERELLEVLQETKKTFSRLLETARDLESMDETRPRHFNTVIRFTENVISNTMALRDLKATAFELAKLCELLSIVSTPLLLDHIRREADKFLDEMQLLLPEVIRCNSTLKQDNFNDFMKKFF
jgi:hypothetical protein